MLKFREKIAKQVETINNVISNDDEKIQVLKAIQSMIQDFTTELIQMKESQDELEKYIVDIESTVVSMQEEIAEISNDMSSDDLYGVCPYCGEEVPIILKDNDFADIECPNCHNTIELEMMYDEPQSCGNDKCGKCCNNNCSTDNSCSSKCSKIVNFEEFKKEIASFESKDESTTVSKAKKSSSNTKKKK